MLVIRKFGVGIAVATLIAAGFASDAMALELNSSWAVRSPYCGVPDTFPPLTRVWLGHFSGGRESFAPVPQSSVDWQEQYACFTSRAECLSWQNSLRSKYRRYTGYRTCLPIR